MDIQARKLHFVQEFLRVADDDIVTKLEKLLQFERKMKLKEDLNSLTLNEFNEIVEKSEDDFKNGRVTEARNLIGQIETWK
ncbi:MAG TPA: hypothetical protein VIK10_05245 [Prolixibacteraceae bacterium]